MNKRKIFKTLISSEEALKRLEEQCKIEPFGLEEVSLVDAYGRVLGEDVVANLDVPNFDRATMDGFAVKSSDTFGAREDQPVHLNVVGVSHPGSKPTEEVKQKCAVEVGTGAPIPKGANAVVMIEYTQTSMNQLRIYRPVSVGENIMPAGKDMMTGEIVLRKWQKISPREVGVLAALGLEKIKVCCKPRVAIISTGKELVHPGAMLEYAQIYDINSSSISAAVKENGAIPLEPIIVTDNFAFIKNALTKALAEADIVLCSGSTSAGAGDILHRIIKRLGPPGIIAHGLTVKPGKPTIIAIVQDKPLIGLPGYPTSALIIFNLIVAPIIRKMAGWPEIDEMPMIDAKVPIKIFSAKGRRELLPVQLISGKDGYFVYPVGLGSGAISSMGLADGYIDIPKNQEYLDENDRVRVKLFSQEIQPADLIVMGSHCTGIDLILQHLRTRKPYLKAKIVNTGSIGGIEAVERGEADIAGIHLLDEDTKEYNLPFLQQFNLSNRAYLIRGYTREQGLIVAKGNPKNIRDFKDILRKDITFINRNRGSGTRVLLDLNLRIIADNLKITFEVLKEKINGYDVEAKSHSAIAAAISQGKADTGLGIRTVSHYYGLDFVHQADEKYDFLIPVDRKDKEAVKNFLDILKSPILHNDLKEKMPGLTATMQTGTVLTGKK